MDYYSENKRVCQYFFKISLFKAGKGWYTEENAVNKEEMVWQDGWF